MSNILAHSFDEYLNMVASFHGSPAPGVLMGGYMIDYAYRNLPEGGEYDIICETAKCLPDAVQLLTPCSIGNRWLKIIDVEVVMPLYLRKAFRVGDSSLS